MDNRGLQVLCSNENVKKIVHHLPSRSLNIIIDINVEILWSKNDEYDEDKHEWDSKNEKFG